ncbi:MAG: glycosyltransferase family 39 protein [Calditrichia bacterium]
MQTVRKYYSARDKHYLIFLLGAALLLRLWGIGYGLPATYNSTEYFIAKQALSLGARQTLEPLYFIYPTLYLYLIAGFYGLFYFAGHLMNYFPAPSDFAMQFFADPSLFYLLGRMLNAVLIIIAVLVFYRLLRRWVDEKTALILALLLLMSSNIHNFTFWMVPDAAVISGTVLVLYFISEAAHRPLSWGRLITGSLICGLTISAKYTAGFLSIGWLAAIVLSETNARIKLNKGLSAGFLIITGFLIGSPYWIITPGSFLEGLQTIWSQSEFSYNLTTGLPFLWEIREIIFSEWLLGLLLMGTMLAGIFKADRKSVPLLLIIIPTFLLVGSREKKGLDYLLVIFPALLLLMAVFLNRIREKPAYRRYADWLLIAALIIQTPRIFYTNLLRTQTDTRQLTTRWIIDHYSPGTVICYDHYYYDLNLIDVNRFAEYGAGSRYLSPGIREKLKQLKNQPNYYRFILPLLNLQNPRVPPSFETVVKQDPYLYESLRHPHKTLAEIKKEGARLLILNQETYQKFMNNPPPPVSNPFRRQFLQQRRFYRNVFSSLEPVKTFEPDFLKPGPRIIVYEFKE